MRVLCKTPLHRHESKVCTQAHKGLSVSVIAEGPRPPAPPLTRNAARGVAAHELSGVICAGSHGTPSSQAPGRQLDGGQVEDGEQASAGEGTAEGTQEKRGAAGGGIGSKDGLERVEQAHQSPVDGQAAAGRARHVEGGHAIRGAVGKAPFMVVEARIAGAPELNLDEAGQERAF